MWIDFEGIDGSGKTSVSNRVAEELRRRGVRVVHAREGGRFGSAIAGRVRDFVRSEHALALAPEAELLLNLAREAQLTAEVILPALRQGAWVITDRTIYSHLGLAEYVRGLPRRAAEAAASFAVGGLRPDRVFLIDVDPDVARWRRRVRKIRERRLGDSGRKGLVGEALAWRTRRAFREYASCRAWTVIDNTWRTLEETVRETLAALDGAPPPAEAPRGFEADPDDVAGSYFRFVAGLADRSLAAMLVAGLDDPRADEIRRGAPADEAAHAVTAMDTPGAWALREVLRHDAPYYVARSLTGLGGRERAWRLRRELSGAEPDQVLHSLRDDAGGEAHRLRQELWDGHREEALGSLRRLDDAPSWRLRERARRETPSAGLAESLAGLDSPPAWELRSELAGFPLAVLRSVEGIDHPRAWAIREDLAKVAPKVALATMAGMDGARARGLRALLCVLSPEETAASLAGLDTPEAWDGREGLKDAAPVGVLKSLRGAGRPRGEALAAEILRRHPARLRVAREALQFGMQPQ